MKMKSKNITICGMFAALIAIGAFIRIDIPLPFYTMHFTMQWFFVLMASMLLETDLAVVSVLSYLILGLVGLPVFASGGGIQYVLRPGFGFLLGFVLAAWVIGTIRKHIKKSSCYTYLLAGSAGMIAYYAVGAVYFYMIQNLYLGITISLHFVIVQYCLITLIPDFVLCVLASMLSYNLRPRLSNIME